MAIQAIFPPGQAAITVNGLHQWDYGQLLEIHADDLPALVEVHFACAGMAEAVVRSGAPGGEGVNRTVEVAIPNSCLEQTSPVTAWVYLVDSTSGSTSKTITLPIIARPRPQPPSGTVPEEISDKYTEAIETMNDLVEDVDTLVQDLAGGAIPIESVAHAKEADHAKEAEQAARAGFANYASESDLAYEAGVANQARMAETADKATSDALGQTIHRTYAERAELPYVRQYPCNDVLTSTAKILVGKEDFDLTRTAEIVLTIYDPDLEGTATYYGRSLGGWQTGTANSVFCDFSVTGSIMGKLKSAELDVLRIDSAVVRLTRYASDRRVELTVKTSAGFEAFLGTQSFGTNSGILNCTLKNVELLVI